MSPGPPSDGRPPLPTPPLTSPVIAAAGVVFTAPPFSAIPPHAPTSVAITALLEALQAARSVYCTRATGVGSKVLCEWLRSSYHLRVSLSALQVNISMHRARIAFRLRAGSSELGVMAAAVHAPPPLPPPPAPPLRSAAAVSAVAGAAAAVAVEEVIELDSDGEILPPPHTHGPSKRGRFEGGASAAAAAAASTAAASAAAAPVAKQTPPDPYEQEEECLICLNPWNNFPSAFTFACRCKAAIMCWPCMCGLAGLDPATGAPLPADSEGPVDCPLCSQNVRGIAIVTASHPLGASAAAAAAARAGGGAAGGGGRSLAPPVGKPLPCVPKLKPPPGPLRVGEFARVRAGVAVPRYQWGRVRPGEVGVIVQIQGAVVTMAFPSQGGWKGALEEMERAAPF